MTNEEILAQQVEALEKLIQLKQAIIEELETKVVKLQNEKHAQPSWQPYMAPYLGGGTITIGADLCTGGGAHQYPQVWNGVFPPPCQKCGKMSGSITSTNIGTIQTSTATTADNVFTLTNNANK